MFFLSLHRMLAMPSMLLLLLAFATAVAAVLRGEDGAACTRMGDEGALLQLVQGGEVAVERDASDAGEIALFQGGNADAPPCFTEPIC